jgi:hypothetical protein
LKEELVNTPKAKEVLYLKEKFPNLIRFVDFMDNYFKEGRNIDQSEEILVWN